MVQLERVLLGLISVFALYIIAKDEGFFAGDREHEKNLYEIIRNTHTRLEEAIAAKAKAEEKIMQLTKALIRQQPQQSLDNDTHPLWYRDVTNGDYAKYERFEEVFVSKGWFTTPLTEDILRKSLILPGNLQRMARFNAKLKRGECTKVLFLGGSVTVS